MTNKPIGEVIAEIKNHHKRMGDAISSGDTTEWEAAYRHLISPINIIPVLNHIAAIEQQLAAERARVAKLPPERFRYGESEYDDGFANGWNAYKTEVARELSAIGIPVEGE